MGYRTYIYKMPKREYNKIKSLTIEEFTHYKNVDITEDNQWYLPAREFGQELYEFGKYTDFTPPKGTMKTFFKKKDLNRRYNEDGELFLVTKDFLKYIIDYYKQKILNYYINMTQPFLDDEEFFKNMRTNYSYPNNSYIFDFSKITVKQQTAIRNMFEHLHSFRYEWDDNQPFKLDDQNPTITDSWKYEYGIFELVRIYKTFDWKKDIMYFNGW